jgi:mono/diheme cytochrome c family protein
LNKILPVIFILVVTMLLQGPAGQGQNATPAGNAANGKIAFMKAACYSCHGTLGQDGPGGRLAPMKISNKTFVNAVRNGKKDEDQSKYWDGMPAFPTRFVSDSELADIYAYLASIPAPPPVKDIPFLKN